MFAIRLKSSDIVEIVKFNQAIAYYLCVEFMDIKLMSYHVSSQFKFMIEI